MQVNYRRFAIASVILWVVALIVMGCTSYFGSKSHVDIVWGFHKGEKIVLQQNEFFAVDKYEIVPTNAGKDIVIHIVEKE